MTTQPSRAEWWREVTDPDEIIEKGRWYRIEYQKETTVAEHLADIDRPRSDWHEGANVFVDSRWKPPLKVGDAVTTSEQLDSLPIKAIVLDAANDAFQKFMGRYEWEEQWCGVRARRSMSSKELLRWFLPITILWLPEGADQ